MDGLSAGGVIIQNDDFPAISFNVTINGGS
jgi:hypothetical protein